MSSLVELNSELIKFKSTADRPEELKRVVDFVEDYFSDCDVVIKRHESKEKPSIVVTLKDTKNPELFLVAHLDVVPAEDSEFEPRVEGDKLYGRGSVDNKASAAIIMELIKYYSKQENKPNIGLMFTTDEEIGGKDGAKYLLEDEGYSCEFAIVMDSGMEGITTKQKGAFHVKLTAEGKAAHGSRPWKGENAINKLMDFYYEIKKDFPQVTEEDNWKKTINLGKFQGGTATNKVPEKAEMHLDFRFTKDGEKGDIIQKIERAGFEYKVTSDHSYLSIDKDHEFIQKLKESIEKIKDDFKFEVSHGATDASHFAAKGITTALFMPKGDNIHAKEEYVGISSMKTVYDILKDFVNENF